MSKQVSVVLAGAAGVQVEIVGILLQVDLAFAAARYQHRSKANQRAVKVGLDIPY